MDTITQFALGTTVGYAGFGHRLGRAGALFGGICGIVPDLDFLLGGGDPWQNIVVHRAESHSLLVLPLVAIPLGALAWQLCKRRDTIWIWIHLALWGLVTHPLLDVFTSYGTQLFAPVSNYRFALDGVFIIDLIPSIPLLVLMVMCLKKVRRANLQRLSQRALAFVVGYIVLGVMLSMLAMWKARSQLDEMGFEPVAMRATPTYFNNVFFRVVARDADRNLAIGYASTFSGADAIALEVYPWPADDPWVAKAVASPNGEIFDWFADGLLLARSEPSADGEQITVYLSAATYGAITDPGTSVFGAEFVFDATSGELLESARSSRPTLDVGAELSALGRGIVGR